MFSQNRLLQHIGYEASQLGYTAYVVGGMVRDAFLYNDDSFVLNIEADVDIVLTCSESTTRDATDFAHFMQQTYGGQVTTHQRFRTATWLLDSSAHTALATHLSLTADKLPTSIDLITARKEIYPGPAVLPTVQPSFIEDDLARRDFTINTLAVCLHPAQQNQLLDLQHGVDDLQAGLVQVLHEQSFNDDPTRIFRAARYEQRFGFQMGPETLGYLQTALETGMVAHLTPARVRHEFERIFHEEKPEKSLQRLADLGVLTAVHSGLRFDEQIGLALFQLRSQLQDHEKSSTFRPPVLTLSQNALYWSVWAYRFDESTRIELQARLLWPKETQQLTDGLAAFSQKLEMLSQPDLSSSQVVALLEKVDDMVWSLAALLETDGLTLERLARYAAEWRHVSSELRGGDLHGLNVPRGPLYAQILRGLRYARLDGKITSREDEVEWVKRFLEVNLEVNME